MRLLILMSAMLIAFSTVSARAGEVTIDGCQTRLIPCAGASDRSCDFHLVRIRFNVTYSDDSIPVDWRKDIYGGWVEYWIGKTDFEQNGFSNPIIREKYCAEYALGRTIPSEPIAVVQIDDRDEAIMRSIARGGFGQRWNQHCTARGVEICNPTLWHDGRGLSGGERIEVEEGFRLCRAKITEVKRDGNAKWTTYGRDKRGFYVGVASAGNFMDGKGHEISLLIETWSLPYDYPDAFFNAFCEAA